MHVPLPRHAGACREPPCSCGSGSVRPAAGLAAHARVATAPTPAPTPAPDWSNYEKITLTKDIGEPIDLAVLPDRRVLHTARNGDVRLTDPDTGVTKVVNTIHVYSNSEDGLQTVTLDPDFATNKWVYLYYAPRDDDGALPGDHPGRFGARTRCPPVQTTPTGTSGRATTSSRASSGTRRPTRSTWPPSRSSSRSRPSAASAATSRATSTSTPPATSTSPPATTRPRARRARTASPQQRRARA